MLLWSLVAGEMYVYLYIYFQDEAKYIYRVYKWVSFSFGVLHFVRPLRCINVRRISRRVLRSVFCFVCGGIHRTLYNNCSCCFIWLLLLLSLIFLRFFSGWLYSACIFLACFLLYVIVQIHNEVGTNGTMHTR